MKKINVIGATLLGAAVLWAAPISLHQSQDKGMSLSVDKAQARIGRPLTPGSVAGVHRRHQRRAYHRGSYYGGGYYPYSYHGGHYRYRYHGHYYNHRGYSLSPLSLLVAASKLVISVGQGPQHMLRPFLRLPSAPMHLPLPEKPNLPRLATISDPLDVIMPAACAGQSGRRGVPSSQYPRSSVLRLSGPE